MAEPAVPDGIAATDLDAAVRRDLRGLQKDTADSVARHLVAAGTLVDEDPEQALEHARFARRRASRIAVVREAAGIAAYHAGEWTEALGELRAARRMGGGPGHLAVMADIERALGRPERAIELSRGPEVRELDRAESIELAIVAAGARRDLGELDAAVVSLQIAELEPKRREPWSARLFYAYADNLLATGRESDAVEWFVHAVDADDEGVTDAAARIAELTGDPLDGDDVEFGTEEAAFEGDADGSEATDTPDVSEEAAAEVLDDVDDLDSDDVDSDAADSDAADSDDDPDDVSDDAEVSDIAEADEPDAVVAAEAPAAPEAVTEAEADDPEVTDAPAAPADAQETDVVDAEPDEPKVAGSPAASPDTVPGDRG